MAGRELGLCQVWPIAAALEDPTTIDVIAIHGLDTNSERTWMAYAVEGDLSSEQVHWLQNHVMLPSRIPYARIFTFDWNANSHSDAAIDDLLGHATSFLQQISLSRPAETVSKPIIFIASCFGGLLLAKALVLASAEHNEFHRILKATVGITFLGTPFRGSEAATAAEIRIAIARWAGYAATDRLVKDLDLRNGILEDLIVTFTDLLHDPPTRIPIRCFYETKPSNIARAILPKGLANGLGNVFNKTVSYVLVERESAALHGSKPSPLEVTHAMLNKYRGPQDVNYCKVAATLIKFAEEADNTIQSRDLTSHPLTRIRKPSQCWKHSEPFHRDDVFLCFVPHTTAFRNWISPDEYSFLTYQTPPAPPSQRKNDNIADIAARILAYAIDYCFETSHPTRIILYYDFSHWNPCSDSRKDDQDVADVVREFISQLLWAVQPQQRLKITQALWARFSPGPEHLQNYLDQQDFETVANVMFLALESIGNDIIICIENFGEMLKAAARTKAQSTANQRSFGKFLYQFRAHHSNTRLIVSDSAATLPARLDVSVNVHKVRWNTEWRECLDTLDFHNSKDRYKGIENARLGTTDWFWNHPDYLAWRDKQSGILWIQGKPGSGKSVLAKNILHPNNDSDHDSGGRVQKSLQDETGLMTCEWYYSTRGGDEMMAHLSLLRSLLHQLLTKRPSLFEFFKGFYRKFPPGSHWFDKDMLKKILQAIADSGLQALCLVDALDENEDNVTSKTRQQHMLAFFTTIVSKNERSCLKFLALSRPEDEIERFFDLHQGRHDDLRVIRLDKENKSAIRIIAKAGIESLRKDITRKNYPDYESDGLAEDEGYRTRRAKRGKRLKPGERFAKARTDTKKEADELLYIENYLVDNAEGVILWVDVMIATIRSHLAEKFEPTWSNNRPTWSDVRKLLDELPTKLTDLYARIVEDIQRRLTISGLQDSRKILMWVSGANSQHTLRVVELQEALCLDRTGQRSDDLVMQTNLKDFRYQIRWHCGPFVEFQSPSASPMPSIRSKITSDKHEVSRFDLVQLLHRTAKDFLADRIAALELHFQSEDADRWVKNHINNYGHYLLESLDRPRFFGSTKRLAVGNFGSNVKQTVNWLDDRGFLGFVIGVQALRDLESLARSVLNQPRQGLSSTLLEEAYENSPFFRTVRHEPRIDTTTSWLAAECLYQACLMGRITAVELLLIFAATHVNRGQDDDRDWFLQQMVDAVLLAAVENGIKDLSIILARISCSLFRGTRSMSKLWTLRPFPGRGDTLMVTKIETAAANSGNLGLLKAIIQESQENLLAQGDVLAQTIHDNRASSSTPADDTYTSPESEDTGSDESVYYSAVSDCSISDMHKGIYGALSTQAGLGDSSDSDDTNGDQELSEVRISIELCIDYIKQNTLGFHLMKRVFQLLAINSTTTSRTAVERAFTLYHSPMTSAFVSSKQALRRRVGQYWLKRTPSVYIRRHGIYGAAILLLDKKYGRTFQSDTSKRKWARLRRALDGVRQERQAP